MALKYALKTLCLLAFASVCSSENTSGVLSTSEKLEGSSRILSRRKRFLVFPDGSSFQLVFCTQNHGYLQIGDIVWFGNTAALAWELPTDPKLFYLLKDHEKVSQEAQNRDGASKHVYYLDEDGKVLAKKPYRKKFIINPAFAKRSINDEIKSMDVKHMHEQQLKINILQDLDKASAEFHREGRVSLFPKIEKVMEGLGLRGKECVQRMLCEHAQIQTEQGSFLQEILRATFTFVSKGSSSLWTCHQVRSKIKNGHRNYYSIRKSLLRIVGALSHLPYYRLPPGREFLDPDHREYDNAHKPGNNCAELYPNCTNHRNWSITEKK